MPNAAIHPTAQELTAFALGKLPEAAANTIASHLDKCPACRQAIEKLPADSFVGKLRAAKPGVSALPARASGATNMPATPAVSSAPPKDLPPELASYSKYRFVRELGRGGMGVVYQAEQTVMGRSVAVKVINPSVLAHPDALPRFQSEVRAAAKLDHPNIVRAHDAEQVGSMHLLVMEYVEGTSLAELVAQKGSQSIAYACHYIRQAALGLQHAFEQGMVHRDIKPQNLMVNARGQVKVLDFGLARMRSERSQGGGLTQADAFMGTPEYVAPEQATDARNADTRADIYSLGCTLFFLLAGRPPFQENTIVKQILAQIEKEAPVLHEVRADVPVELSAVVARMLAKDPAKRFQTPLAVADALAGFIKAWPKPDAKSRSALPVGSPGQGTMIAADTRQLKKVLREVPGKSPSKNVPAKDAPSPFAELTGASTAPQEVRQARKAAKPSRTAWWKRPGVLAATVSVSLALILMAGIIIKVKLQPNNDDPGKATSSISGTDKPKPPPAEAILVLEIDQPDAEVTVDGQKISVQVPGDNKPIEIKVEPGRPHKLRVKKDGFEVVTQDVELKSGKRDLIRVQLEPKHPTVGTQPPKPPKPVAEAPGFVTRPVPRKNQKWWDRHKGLVERARKGKVGVLFLGDSITEGWEGEGRDVWEESIAGLNAANFGIRGDRTEDVLWRITEGKELEGIHPRAAVLMIGSNNVGNNNADQIAEGIEAIVKELGRERPDMHILLLGVFPRAAKANHPHRDKIKAVNRRIAKLDDGKQVHYLDIGDKFLQKDGELTQDISPDYLHLSKKGYEIWARAITPSLNRFTDLRQPSRDEGFVPLFNGHPFVVMETSLGAIKIELDAEKAPITVKNFLGYVDDKFYDETIFHRVIPKFMIQGGGFERGVKNKDDISTKQKKTRDPIKNESGNGLINVRGSIAMARRNELDSATAQFFINVADNKKLDDAKYCVFGKVIEGMDVVDRINGVKTKAIGPPAFENVPVVEVVIKTVCRTAADFRRIEIKELPTARAEAPAANGAAAPPSAPRRAEGSLPPEAKEAAKEFEKARGDARAKLLTEFDTVLDRLAKRGGAVAQRLKMIDVVKEEKKRFEERGLISFSEPMRPYLTKYFDTSKAAEDKLSRVYTSLIDAQLRAKNESMVADLKADLESLLSVHVVARWRQSNNGKLQGVRTLYSNFRINNPNSSATHWSYSNGVLKYRLPAEWAVGGFVIDTLYVSADGMTYSGTFTDGRPGKKPKLTGIYVKDD